MKRVCKMVWVFLFFLTGCGDQLYLERVEPTLNLGIDLTEDGQLIFFHSAPTYTEESKKKYNTIITQAQSFRDARNLLNEISYGVIGNRKLQNVILGKRLLRERKVHSLMDVLFRDPKIELNARTVAVDGPVEEVFTANFDGRPGVILRNLIEDAYLRGTGVPVPLHQFHSLVMDQRMTPFMTEIQIFNGKMKVAGTALLDHKGYYADTLSYKDSSLMMLLHNHYRKGLYYPIRSRTNPQSALLSLSVRDSKLDVKTSYRDHHFIFDVKLDLSVDVDEEVFMEHEKEPKVKKNLNTFLSNQVRQDMDRLIKKLQRKQVDPIGFGVYAQAQQYSKWLTVQDKWPQAFSEAEIHLHPRVEVRGRGVIQ